MFHLYLVTDRDGSWPVLREGPLVDGPAQRGTAVVALLGRFLGQEAARAALALAREALLPAPRGAPVAPSRHWLGAPVSLPGPRSSRARRALWKPRRSPRPWLDRGPKP